MSADDESAPEYSADDLALLAESPHQRLRKLAAEHALTPESAFVALAHDVSAEVREAVAENHNAPTAVVEDLARDVAAPVRESAVGNPRCSIEVATQAGLAPREAETNVGFYLAHREDVSPETLAVLAQHHLRLVAEAVAGHPRTPQAALDRLAHHANRMVVGAVAGNSSTHPTTLAMLARHASSYVVYMVAGNVNTPPEELVRLSRLPDYELQERVKRNPSTPETVAHELRLSHTALKSLGEEESDLGSDELMGDF